MLVVAAEVLMLVALEEMVDLAVVDLVEVQTKQLKTEPPLQEEVVVDTPLTLLDEVDLD
tara:strand:- start:1025 stop:1201 length:177 start_codon:yes stop_codon:yes gene_type:complete